MSDGKIIMSLFPLASHRHSLTVRASRRTELRISMISRAAFLAFGHCSQNASRMPIATARSASAIADALLYLHIVIATLPFTEDHLLVFSPHIVNIYSLGARKIIIIYSKTELHHSAHGSSEHFGIRYSFLICIAAHRQMSCHFDDYLMLLLYLCLSFSLFSLSFRWRIRSWEMPRYSTAVKCAGPSRVSAYWWWAFLFEFSLIFDLFSFR